MAQEKTGVESQTVSTKTVTLALAAVFLTYFLSSLMILGLSIASPMIAADLNGMDSFLRYGLSNTGHGFLLKICIRCLNLTFLV